MSAYQHKAFNEAKSLREWAADARAIVSYATIQRRIARGMGMAAAITTPIDGKTTIELTPPIRFTNFAMPAGSYVPPVWGEALGNRHV